MKPEERERLIEGLATGVIEGVWAVAELQHQESAEILEALVERLSDAASQDRAVLRDRQTEREKQLERKMAGSG